MSVQAAINFLSTAQTDAAFRKECYRCKSQSELFELLNSKDLNFSVAEFEDAVNHLLLQCATESQAYSVHEMESWFKLVGRMQ
jgi:hypothetical protein